MAAIPLVIGDQVFPSRRKAEEACKAILYRYEIGQVVADFADHEFLLAVLNKHPRAREKIGVGVVRFEVRRNPKYPSQRSFFFVRTDGSETDFGYNKCLKPPSVEQEVRAALRHSITDQIMEFLNQTFASSVAVRCAVSDDEILRPTDAHVDHAPPTFIELADTFVAEHGGWEAFELSRKDGQVGARLADPSLATAWAAYHRRHARLRIVTINANLSVLRKRQNLGDGA